MKPSLAAFVFSLFTGYYCLGQVNDYPFSKLDIRDGLSNNQVDAIYKDQKGFLWFGTSAGLNRYDGYTCKVFRHNALDTSSLNDDYVDRIYEGPEGKLWLNTLNEINIYDPKTEKFDRRPDRFLNDLHFPTRRLATIVKAKDAYWFVYADSGIYVYGRDQGNAVDRMRAGDGMQGPLSDPVSTAKLDSRGYLWLVHNNGVLEQLDVRHHKVLFRTDALQKKVPNASYGYLLYIDRQDELWLYAQGRLLGLYCYDPRIDSLMHFSKESGKGRLNSNLVNDVIQDDKGLIWIATDQGGLDLMDKDRWTVRYLENSDEERSLSQNSITVLYKDDFGIIWLGTYKKGINYYHANIIRFPLFRHQPGQPNSLPYDDVDRFAEDKKGNLWIGTNGGGLIYFDRGKNSFTRYRHDPANPNSLCSDVIVGLCIDHEGNLWIGSYLAGLDRYDGKRFTHYRHNDATPSSLSDDRVNIIMEDADLDLWVGTQEGGLDRFDREKGIFYHNNPSIPHSIYSRYISSLSEDANGDLWIGTTFGIDVLQKNTGKFIHYLEANSKLSHNNINDLCRDHLGNMWVATRIGLNVLTPGADTFRTFFVKDGLPDNTILNILEDDAYQLWVSTPNGISKIIVAGNGRDMRINCTNYDEYDGLQGREFNENASLKTREGELLFGGGNGFNLFRPSDIKPNEQPPPVVLTDFQLFNKEIRPGDSWNGQVVLKNAIAETNELTLRFNENDFSLGFAALSFANTKKNKYAYMLESFNKNWVMTDGKTRRATYTNIDPGEYRFRVKASNNDGIWNEQGVAINIIVLPPFWKTPLAYFLYVLLLAVALYFARFFIIRRAKARFALAQERREALRMHELDMMKIKFLTNVSHEFRTPLSLILTPVDKLIKSTDDPQNRKQFHLIERNAKRLLNLVNQLLDFRKMEVNELKLNKTQGDIAKFIRETSYSFTDLAEKKNIDFTYRSGVDHLVTLFDQDKIERILFNLLSNAFKFTPEKGKVSVELHIAEEEGEHVLLEIIVQDTGIGILPEMQQRIFETFFQSQLPGNMLNQGSGIGLAITREFVEMHEGSIKVESGVNEGSCFTVLLPVIVSSAETASREIVAGTKTNGEIRTSGEPSANGIQDNKKRGDGKSVRILLVEDNEDFRFYLKDNLKEFFTIIEAANGKEGWQSCLSAHPDLVVSDISMPVMDGVELCRKIKTDERTRHIPVILLTALTGEQDQLRALETGPNDYITKPFNFEILVSRIRNLLNYKETVKKTYQKLIEVRPRDIASDDVPEEDFIQRALAVIEKHMGDPEFSVEEWAQELLLSRTSLYKKIVALTGKTPIEFIRSIRLKRSAQLLERTQHNITEIAYMVGFNNPKYFARYFKEEFNILPSAYQAEKRKKK
jgi:signal transduction histidine kinase/ligand-binding sensor domain-containing protein/CheY-like chemotaxis protein/AraC-like DNA-binding protein